MPNWKVLQEALTKADIVNSLLTIRNVTDIADFLNPPHPLLYLKSFDANFKEALKAAKDLVYDTISRDEAIVIYGDYDADGVCATAILYNFFKSELKYAKCLYFIPNRFDHGYGLSRESIDEVLANIDKEKVLFITVDTGITAVEATKYIKDLGHKIIITDHHQQPAKLPSADILLWTDRAVGAAIAWFLARVLGSEDITSIGLAALATVTDVQPLLDLNRSIVKAGLKVLNTNPPAGIKELLVCAGKSLGELSTYELGWVIGPRLNASGRIEDAAKSLELLVGSIDTIPQIAHYLNNVNTERQTKTLEMYELAKQMLATEVPDVIFSAHAKYHEGIIGLVASWLVKEFNRPSIVIALGDSAGKGSVRSIDGIDIIAILRQYGELFTELGGHPMAAGFTIPIENIDSLKESLTRHFQEVFSDGRVFEQQLDIDLKLPLQWVDFELIDLLEQFKPFGVGNKTPVFLSEKVGLTDIKTVGKTNEHLSLRFYSEGVFHKGILFNHDPALCDILKPGETVDVVYSLQKNSFNGRDYIDLMVKDIANSV